MHTTFVRLQVLNDPLLGEARASPLLFQDLEPGVDTSRLRFSDCERMHTTFGRPQVLNDPQLGSSKEEPFFRFRTWGQGAIPNVSVLDAAHAVIQRLGGHKS